MNAGFMVGLQVSLPLMGTSFGENVNGKQVLCTLVSTEDRRRSEIEENLTVMTEAC